MLNDICRLQPGIRTKRISSYDRTGGNDDYIAIAAGTTAELAMMEGAGIVKHIWITLNCEDSFIRRNAIIRMYWDGEEEPSVESPLGDFFGQGFGEAYNFVSLPLAAAPQQGKALNSYFSMPYGKGARITLENQSAEPIKSFYYYIDYEVHPEMPETMGRFHASWRREITGVQKEVGENEWATLGASENNPSVAHNYVFADIAGSGHFVGINYYVDNPGPMWYGEGDDMWLIDGEDWPGSLHGTGTEDFFNSSWCPNETYAHPFFGYAKVPDRIGWMGRTHCYRFFLQDPIRFEKSLHASIEHGHDNCLTLDLSTVAYWYQTEPHLPYPALPAKELRGNMPVITERDVHLWRHEWRKAKGNASTLWGNEK
ncbi:glycoside hydrolase family 172 protein [Paenibacillus sacheonensis]|uniref:DUF2961 domain-containing protein n=1 Tax=Paenibacillus sacheonensis TaxID=742054 RepID=A0A7X4YRL1_9BACL|nr:glycoside hydrolase family 172 protein [Paenibacillus sacheonensis]MBM7566128.1 hypothetical protein [Paenibacillus sacheonensis]NBC70341.1 DUF2961 domain-containing protein [Paenibacillus sacheonensis]